MAHRALARIASLTLAIAGCNELEKKLEAEISRGEGDDLAVEASRAFKAGKYGEAAAKYEEALAKGLAVMQEDDVETALGNAYAGLDEHDKAIAHHEKALTINPQNYMAMVNLGATYRQMGELDEAEKMYRRAMALAPEYAELHASLGALHLYQNRLKDAHAALRKAVELDPKLAVAHANMAMVELEMGQLDDAEASLARATALGYANAAIIRARLDAARGDGPVPR